MTRASSNVIAFALASAACQTHAQPGHTKSAVKGLHAIAEVWRSSHASECPTVQRLKDERAVSVSTDIHDVWGSPYEIHCDGAATTVLSWGPDRKAGTEDDIRCCE